jgi:putative two-component system response regulator
LQGAGRRGWFAVDDVTESSDRPSILIVDDHQDTCEMLARMCERRGLTARYVLSGKDAIDAVREQTPAVLVLDQMMPDATGLDVLERLQAEGRLEKTPVVFVSAMYDWHVYQRAMRLGAKAWLVKGTVRLADVVDEVARHATVG